MDQPPSPLDRLWEEFPAVPPVGRDSALAMVGMAQTIYRDQIAFPAEADGEPLSAEEQTARLLGSILGQNELEIVIRPAGQIRHAMQFIRNKNAFLAGLAAETQGNTLAHELWTRLRGTEEAPSFTAEQLAQVGRCVRHLGFGPRPLQPRLEAIFGHAAPRLQDIIRDLVTAHLCAVIVGRADAQEQLQKGIQLCCRHQHFPLGELRHRPGTYLVLAP